MAAEGRGTAGRLSRSTVSEALITADLLHELDLSDVSARCHWVRAHLCNCMLTGDDGRAQTEDGRTPAAHHGRCRADL